MSDDIAAGVALLDVCDDAVDHAVGLAGFGDGFAEEGQRLAVGIKMEGTRRAISTPVITGTKSSHGVISNLAPSDSVNKAMCDVSEVS